MTYEVKLEIFEGPLDLLLHLITKNEVQITDIPIAMITSQYLETVHLMQSLNLDIAGEYLLMAAYLTHIKSLMLLPSEDHQEELESGEDPRNELVAHLLEYKRYKEAAETMNQFQLLDRDVFTRNNAGAEFDLMIKEEPPVFTPQDLIDIFCKVIARTSRKDLMELQPERLLVKDKMVEIMRLLNIHGEMEFHRLFEVDNSKINILTSLLAVLELVKLQALRIYQDAPFGPIVMKTITTRDFSLDDDFQYEPARSI